MLWNEKGVCKGSYICFFDTPDVFKQYYYYMVSCGFFQCDNNYMIKDKGSRPPIFFYITKGSLEINYQSEHFTAHKNDIVLLNCFNPQQYYCVEDSEFLFFHYNGLLAPALTDYLIEDNQSPVFTLSNSREIYHTINEPIMRLCYQDQVSNASLSSLVYSSLCMIQEKSDSRILSYASSKRVSDDVITYINQNIQKHFSVEELGNQAGLSPFYFSRLFKEETGFSPMDYVAVTKINYAKMMLRTTMMSVSEIGEFLGYSSPASFINAFKARCGLSPKKYKDEVVANMKDTTAAHEK